MRTDGRTGSAFRPRCSPTAANRKNSSTLWGTKILCRSLLRLTANAPSKTKDTFFFKLYHFRKFYDSQLFGPSVLWSPNFSSISRPITKRPLGHSCILHPPHVTPPLPSASLNILHIIGFSQLLSICS